MVEESLPTFEAYCKNVDVSSLMADQARSRQYLSLVETYSDFATPDRASKVKRALSFPELIRWRTAALRAIRAVVGSDALAADSPAQLNAVVPVILENLSLENDEILNSLQAKAQIGEKQSTEVARRRRLSIATVSTVDTTDGNPVGTSTTADADKVAEEEVRVLAIRCLKQIFSISTASTRGQTRLATALTVKFIAAKQKPLSRAGQSPGADMAGNWATSLFEAIARWTPVQDRFVIIVTAMETLTRSPIIESLLDKQLILAQLIDWLLRSDINLIGLSVMDVLLGLVHHMLLLLQLGGRDSKLVPHAQQNDVFGIYREAHEAFDPGAMLAEPDPDRQLPTESTPSPIRLELLSVLQRCISDLGTHIYYTDQITDMLTAILARLKPSASSEVTSTTAAINNPAAATRAIADSISLQEDPATDNFFSFATARVVALNAVRDIIVTANSKRISNGLSAEVRSRVGVQVWEGTQWLLKDEDQEVRLAYVEALVTWLKYETNKNDTMIPKDGPRKGKNGKKETGLNGDTGLARRAVSNASRKESKVPKSNFHQLLVVTMFDNALDLAESEVDILALFLLLGTLIERLGVNAVRVGLPMIATLQSTVLASEGISSPRAKINVASLVHGYFWAVAEKFDLETTKQGRDINDEIMHRKKAAIWLNKIRIQPTPMDQIRALLTPSEKEAVYSEESTGNMKSFSNITDFVNEISYSYDNALISPPNSPPSSPGRVFSVPTLGFGYGYGIAPAPKPSPEDQLSQKVKEEMCSSWSRDVCMANVEKESTGSINGSRNGASFRGQQHLSVNSPNLNGGDSPASAQEGFVAPPIVSGLGSLSKQRRLPSSTSDVNLAATSSRESTMKVSDLKRALSGYQTGVRNGSPLRRPATASRRSVRSEDSESLLSWNDADDFDVSTADVNSSVIQDVRAVTMRPATARSLKVRNTVHDQTTLEPRGAAYDPNSDIPPVPEIPSALNLPGTFPRESSPGRPQTAKDQTAGPIDTNRPLSKQVLGSSLASLNSVKRTDVKHTSRPGSRAGSASVWSQKQVVTSKADLSNFLAGIETGLTDSSGANKENGKKRLIVPPY